MRHLCTLLGGLLLATGLAAQAPVNDNCSGALLLNTGDTSGATGNFSGATASAGIPDNCTYSDRPDLWYRFVAQNSRQVILLQATTADDYFGGLKVFSGSCDTLQAVTANCAVSYSSVLGGGHNRVKLTASGLVPGNSYYLRLNNAYNYSSLFFRLSVRNETPAPGCVTLLEPAAGAANVNYELPQTFRWSAAAGAARYELRISTPGSSDRVFYTADTTYPVRLAAGSYTWQVKAVNATDDASSGCATASFSTCATAANPVSISVQGSAAFCAGNSARLVASASVPGAQWFRDYAPVAGATADTLVVTGSATYSLRILGANGCYSDPSNYRTVSELPLPFKPHVTAIGPADICNGSNPVTLTAAGLYNAQWFRVGSSSGTYTDTLTTSSAGGYYVRIYGTNGCNNNSDTFTVRSLFTPPTHSITATGNQLSVPAGYEYYQWYRDGAAIAGATANQYTALENGSYRVEVGNSATCKTSSTALTFTGTAVSTVELQGVTCTVYPNPVQNALRVEVRGGRKLTLSLLDAQGRTLKTVLLKPGVTTLSVSDLPAGLYHAVLTDGSRSRSVSLVKVL